MSTCLSYTPVVQSPFLGMEVLYEVADNTDVLPHAVQLEIFMANPHCVRDARFMEHLSIKTDPMPLWMVELLAGQADVRTLKDNLENTMTLHTSKWSYHADEVLKVFHSDSAYFNPDSLVLWNTIKGDMLSVADLHSGMRTYTVAAELVNDLLDLYEYEKEFAAELETRRDLYSILAAAENADRPYWMLSDVEQNQLLVFAESGNLSANREAKNILAFYYGFVFIDELPDFNEPKSLNNKPPQGIKPTANSSTVKTYPNPSRGQVIFEYRYPGIIENLHIEIYTADGTLFEKIRMQGSNGIHVWDCKNCPSGNYVYRITSTGKQLDSGVLQINK